MRNFFFRNLPGINFCISSTALTFQVTVLYPWHNEISKQIDNISNFLNEKDSVKK